MPVPVLVVERRAALDERHKLLRVHRRLACAGGVVDVLGEVQHRPAVAIRHAQQRSPRLRRERQFAA